VHPLQKFRYCPACGSERFIVQNDKSKFCRQCGFQYYLNAVAAVAGFIVYQGKLLLCMRGQEPLKGTYDLPGGFVDINETAENALVREIFEELNLITNNLEYLFSVPNEYLYSDFNVRTLDLFFRIEINDFSPLKSNDDVAGIHFVSLQDVDIEQIGLKSIKIAVNKFLESQLVTKRV
jgi:ADP-ribose pyrophosphatase YjhB (NUDIX family)